MNRIVLDGDERDFLVWREASGGTVEIFDIAVGSERRVGNGRRMVEMLLETLAGKVHLVWAITRMSNEIAKEFYAGLGFRIIAVLGRFYVEEDAVLFGKAVQS